MDFLANLIKTDKVKNIKHRLPIPEMKRETISRNASDIRRKIREHYK